MCKVKSLPRRRLLRNLVLRCFFAVYNLFNMAIQPLFSDEQLSAALADLGVDFIIGDQDEFGTVHMKPESLISGLAMSQDARLRLSLIPLFLNRPDLSIHAEMVCEQIGKEGQITLQCYYQAAVWLQMIFRDQIEGLLGPQQTLTNLFSSSLKVSVIADPEENLRRLAKRQEELSQKNVNWLGTYYHAIEVWLRGTELQRG